MRTVPASLQTSVGSLPLQLGLADSFLKRLRGLLLRPPLVLDQGLLITRCISVHCVGMHYPIDVVWLDAQGQVVGHTAKLRPWRMAWGPRGTVHTLELPAGAVARLGLQVGHCLLHPRLDAQRCSVRFRKPTE